MNRLQKFNLFVVFTFFLGAISPSIRAIAATSASEKTATAMKQAIKKRDEECNHSSTTTRSLKIGKNAYTDEANARVMLPKRATNPIVIEELDDFKHQMSMILPDEFATTAETTKVKDIAIYSSPKNAQLGLQNTEQGFRALIQVDNEKANHDYIFAFRLPKDYRLITSSEYLGEEFDTGEVYIVNAQNQITSIFSPAWAKDANGDAISTSYIVNGNQLTQHIDFDEHSIFPIVADPLFDDIINSCAFAIAAFIASTAFPIAKIARVKRYINVLGGLREAARAIKLAGGMAAARQARGVLRDLVIEIGGFALIESNCF